MEVETRDWHALCEAASREYDPEQLLELVSQLVSVLEEKKTTSPDLPRARTYRIREPISSEWHGIKG